MSISINTKPYSYYPIGDEIPVGLTDLIKLGQVLIGENYGGGNSVKFKHFCGYVNLRDERMLVVPPNLLATICPDVGQEDYNSKLPKLYNAYFEKFLLLITERLPRLLPYNPSFVYHPGDPTPDRPHGIFKLFTLLHFADKIPQWLNKINERPHGVASVVKRTVPADQADSISPESIIHLIKNPEALQADSNGMIQSGNRRYNVRSILNSQTETTYDVVENGFIKYMMETIVSFCLELKKKYCALYPTLEGKLDALAKNIKALLNTDFWNSVKSEKHPPFNSNVLQKQDGYKDFLRFYHYLKGGYFPQFDSQLQLALSLKDLTALWELYHLTILLPLFNSIMGDTSSVDTKRWNTKEYEVDSAKFTFRDNSSLNYQQTRKSYTGKFLRPDFCIHHNGNEYILDSKFSVFGESIYTDQIIKDLHRYRDGLKTSFAVAMTLTTSNELHGQFYPSGNTDPRSIAFQDITTLIKENASGVGYIPISLPQF